MPFDKPKPQATAAATAGTPKPVWARLMRPWAPAPAATPEPELGYESALPWTLDVDSPAEPGTSRY